MYRNPERLALSAIVLVATVLLCAYAYAATPIDLERQKLTVFQTITSPRSLAAKGIRFEEINRSYDFKHTLHVRIQETYMGFPVWGGDAIVHVPNGGNTTHTLTGVISAASQHQGSMNGTIYQDLNADLANTPAYVFSDTQAQKSIQEAVNQYQEKAGTKSAVEDQKTRLIVFIDEKNKAHWAYQVSFAVPPVREGQMPAKPVYILDAISFQVYAHWNNVKTIIKKHLDATSGGGFGGNKKMGKLVYDGLPKDLPKLDIMRDAARNLCFLQNKEITVKHYKTDKVITFPCSKVDPTHNNVYWDGDREAINGGYNPANDALFGGIVIKKMYQSWYGVPVLIQNGKPMMLNMIVHDHIDNAYWDGTKMTFGDGVSIFYPLTSIGVAGHEISHGFTEQHSDLMYYSQPGGLNEAFSDMAAQAAEFFAYGKNSWQIGPEIFKEENAALRYMDKPSKDCNGGRPGDWCSIDDASQYFSGLDVHYSSGVYNHFFYLLATTTNWDTRKAFDVMVQANMHYWTSSSNFVKAACGVLKATKDLGYDISDVQKAFAAVKIDTHSC